MLEKLLIEQIVICYLRLYLYEYHYNSLIESPILTPKLRKEWESLLSSAQKRYLYATETLVRIRRLNINVQVNVAAEGGQQINVMKDANQGSKK